ncbi:MAG: hypothetical protein P4L62_02460 [Candidatus Pacebacteria bacterium]|nr:hypothetical protein [Candidatus Paceibacterota bacterium]MDR3583196.1 hypothetical protein [Candidatus Paceibacterota bacterium]
MENHTPGKETKPLTLQPEKNKKVDHSKIYRTAAITVGAIFLAILIFAGGVVVGLRKARFSYSFGQNYERNFVGMRGPIRGGMTPEGPGFRDAHGLAGTIISVAGNNIVVKDRSGQENTVSATDKTLIKYQGNNLKIGDLKQNEQIVILGRPSSNGTVSADLIRVFDNLPPDTNNQASNNQINPSNQ